MMRTPTITCPRCGRTSHHPVDVKEGYCGACHGWTGRPLRDWRAIAQRQQAALRRIASAEGDIWWAQRIAEEVLEEMETM